MEIEIKQTKRITVDRLRAECGVRYWEDAIVNGEPDEYGKLIPLRLGDYWCPTIMLETGRILDWPEGTEARVHYKVCDDGRYSLLSPAGEVVVTMDDYVPSMMSPAGNGYGDYVIMSIGHDGVIAGWKADLAYFEDQE